MRVSTPTMSSTMNRFITQHNEKREKINKQMMTQQRITLPSEDPIASTRLLQINREQANIKQYSSNINGLSNSLTNQTGHVSAINKQLVSIKDSLLSINDSVKSNKDISGIADELNYMLESVVAGLNAKNSEGRYLFAGTESNKQPITFDKSTNKYTYIGNGDNRQTGVGEGVKITENVHLQPGFSDNSDQLATLNKLKKLCDDIKQPTVPGTVVSHTTAIDEMMGLIDNASDHMGVTLTELGIRQKHSQLLQKNHEEMELSNATIQEKLVGLDLAESYMELMNLMAVTNANYTTFKQINSLSLFNLI
ncbi:flagellar hook-associated protein FlgL [Yersinia pseudotuberculosis]|uniref:flagellar hook-associated protein FlgL n=1 Tax=Yersinia pseudotuberculosis TaxID=633 RepID=UPI0005AD397D|nr:flagellar hook-associated protein FlgL [Yersinia pseudotuberculosis]AJK16277.1 flagellar hook-associated protein 3 [Yersinia pseudotuberculosis str. PA3606]BCU89225.1 flagellar hook-associated protein 3 [Yersinia pseudotuberculosis]